MNRDLAHIAARAFNTPLLIQPRKAEVIASVLAERISGIAPLMSVEEAKAEAETSRAGRSQMLDRFDGERRGPKVTNSWGETYTQTRYLFKDAVGLVTVEGTLINRGAYIGSSSGLTSYEGVMAQLASAAADRAVEQIVLDLESPGGEATGAFEMADFVAAIAAQKPVTAVVNGLAASAAYAMASNASRVITSPSGVSGSIGVVMLHLDRSKQLDKMGVSPTLIFAGGHKVDGNPFEPIPEGVRADFQAEVDQLYSMFVDTVARGRRNLTSDAIRATEARTFIGAAAVDAGLADEIGTLAEVVDSLKPRGGSSRITSRGATMSQEHKAPPAAEAGISEAQFENAVAAARAEGEKAGRSSALAEAGAAIAELFPNDARAEVFAEALKDGVALATAVKFAAKQQPAAKSALHAEMAGAQTINLGPAPGAGGGAELSPYDKGAAEAASILKYAGLGGKR